MYSSFLDCTAMPSIPICSVPAAYSRGYVLVDVVRHECGENVGVVTRAGACQATRRARSVAHMAREVFLDESLAVATCDGDMEIEIGEVSTSPKRDTLPWREKEGKGGKEERRKGRKGGI